MIKWKAGKTPADLSTATSDYGDRLTKGVEAIAKIIAADLQNDMRSAAPWRDRTGNARANLFGLVEAAAKDITTIYLVTGMEYGKWLELKSYGGLNPRYAVIMPTIKKNMPKIARVLKNLGRV